MTNLEYSFECATEEAKESFRANISSLLEVSSLIKSTADKAAANGKSVIYFLIADAETLHKWIMNAAGDILADYNTLDRRDRKAMRLFNAGRKIEDKSRCTCKHLIAADQALVEWERYKQSKKVV